MNETKEKESPTSYVPSTPSWLTDAGIVPPGAEPKSDVRWDLVVGTAVLIIGADIIFYLFVTWMGWNASRNDAVMNGTELPPYLLSPWEHPVLLWVIAGFDAIAIGIILFANRHGFLYSDKWGRDEES